jgi:hypothetical protein
MTFREVTYTNLIRLSVPDEVSLSLAKYKTFYKNFIEKKLRNSGNIGRIYSLYWLYMYILNMVIFIYSFKYKSMLTDK